MNKTATNVTEQISYHIGESCSKIRCNKWVLVHWCLSNTIYPNPSSHPLHGPPRPECTKHCYTESELPPNDRLQLRPHILLCWPTAYSCIHRLRLEILCIRDPISIWSPLVFRLDHSGMALDWLASTLWSGFVLCWFEVRLQIIEMIVLLMDLCL